MVFVNKWSSRFSWGRLKSPVIRSLDILDVPICLRASKSLSSYWGLALGGRYITPMIQRLWSVDLKEHHRVSGSSLSIGSLTNEKAKVEGR